MTPLLRQRRRDAAPEEPVTVYVDSLLRERSTRQKGYRPYTARAAVIEGQAYTRALVTEAGNARPDERSSTLTLKLDGRYERFQATVGRDDTDALRGAAFAAFEVWGDDKPLFRSAPIRSSRTLVRTAPGARTRRAPEEIEVSVRGVALLQLVTRYAAELTQQAAQPLGQARGCVWGDARLIAPSSQLLLSGGGDSALRDTLRLAALQVAGAAAAAKPQNGRLPMRLGVAPLYFTPGSSSAGIPAERIAALRSLLEQQLLAARRGAAILFMPLTARQAAQATRALTVRGDQPEPTPAAIAATGRQVRADCVLLGTLSRAGDDRWTLLLRLVETQNAVVIATTETTMDMRGGK